MHRPQGRLGPLTAWAAAGFGVLLALHFAAAPAPRAGLISSGIGGVRTLAPTPCSTILANSTINGTISSVYTTLANSTNLNLTRWPAQSSIDAAVAAMFQTVCAISSFQSLIGSWGATNFSLQFNETAPDIGLGDANYTVGWQQWSKTQLVEHTEWWSGAINNLQVSGPFSQSGVTTMTAAALNTPNWAGWEWWSNVNGGTQSLHGEWAVAPTVVMTNPACCQTGVPGGWTIDAVGAVWTGLAPQAGGAGGLLQTGYVYDSTSPTATWCIAAPSSCNYGLWWEFLPGPPFMYTGNPHTAIGHHLTEAVVKAASPANAWTTLIHDWTVRSTYTNTVVKADWIPKYATFIVEAPTLRIPPSPGSEDQQIPYFGPVSFEAGYLQNAANVLIPVTSPHAAGTFNVYTLNQRAANSNTAEAFSNPCNGYTGLTWCAGVTYTNSNYDYPYV
jgi:hypothetical protein